MDSWKIFSEGKGGLLSEELDFPMDGHGKCKTQMMECEMKPFFNLESYPLVSNTQALERLDFMDLGFSDEIRKSSYSLSSEPSGEVFSDEIGADSYGNVVSPFCEERDSGSRISAGFMISNNTQDCSLFDLKLGRLEDGERAKESEFTKANVNVYAPSTTMLSPPAKRARLMSLHSQPPFCQVFGCNKDLSSCKGYYKRHKVCDMHTKTTKVIVDGIEQRFCQQCSRFHVLNEFDDGKRSCRRRLAAHNKRRRKPQLTSESGTGIIGFSSPFSFPGVEPGVIVNPGEKIYIVPTPKTPNLSGILQKNHALSLLSAQSNLSGISWGPQSQSDTVKNMNNRHALGQGIVLDLLQLSSHLQRIEHQRHSTESEAG